ncbi:MAG TPA: membrane protein insertase YidC [Chthoniobacteraceae bacterium]|jgi:YidC/Oxa1 family membrane protein insertase
MDRKGIIAVTLSVITLFAWTFYNQREMDKAAAYQRSIAQEAQRVKAEEEARNPPAPVPAAEVPAVPSIPAAPVVEEKTQNFNTAAVDYTFSNLGGGISRALLRSHEAERGQKMVMNEFGAIPIGAITEVAGEGARTPFNLQIDPATGVISFERIDARQLKTEKKFTLPNAGAQLEDYVVQLDVSFTNQSSAPIALPGYFVHTGSAAPVHQDDLVTYTGVKAAGGKFIDASWFASGGFLFWSHPDRPVYTESRPNSAWLGVANQYFTTIVTPRVTSQDSAEQAKQRGNAVWARRLTIPDANWKASGRSSANVTEHYGVDGALGMPGFSLEAGKTFSQSFTIYSGPREYQRLAKLGADQEDILDFGMFGIVSRTLLNGMNWLNARFGSYAAAIIVLTLIIKSLLWPLQNKATQSMKRMQLLQPKMLELREKYADDPARMNTETMKLYRDYGANPLSGCLPMLIQIPIFFGFYNMLGKAVELRNSKFLWVPDLSQPDTIFHLAGVPVNILPLVMAGTMFWQMAISPKTGDPMQQRIFMFMPLIFIFFCYNFASALALYWTVQNLFSVVQLYATRNQAPPQLTKKVTAPAKRK